MFSVLTFLSFRTKCDLVLDSFLHDRFKHRKCMTSKKKNSEYDSVRPGCQQQCRNFSFLSLSIGNNLEISTEIFFQSLCFETPRIRARLITSSDNLVAGLSTNPNFGRHYAAALHHITFVRGVIADARPY